MNTLTPPHPKPSAASGPTVTSASPVKPVAPQGPGRLVTDAPMRMFHWLFALSFVGAYISAESEHWRLVHVVLGYTLADLVVLGTHGRRGLGRMLLGSGAEQVIRLSPVPVLVVRGD